jgi:glycosyltransferase involved in cell wall biosynthesis
LRDVDSKKYSLNILFLYNETINPEVGGVERITASLADYFQTKGISVYFLSFNDKYSISDNRQYYLPNKDSIYSIENQLFFKDFLFNFSINVVINQGATNREISKLSFLSRELGVKLISAIHNSPLAIIKNYAVVKLPEYQKKGIGWILYLLKFRIFNSLIIKLYKIKYSSHYLSIIRESNFIVLESLKYEEELFYLVNAKKINNLRGIHNPIPFVEASVERKKNEVLYVGRLNTSQKRVDLLLHVWSLVHEKHSDWTLKIVGGGDELDDLKKMAKDLKLTNIIFYGFSDPKPYYQTASIFCMTSSFEGLPMTLLEAMYFGVTPIAFNSFLSLSEIIENDINGVVVEAFDIVSYANHLSDLMLNKSKLEKFSIASRLKSRNFNLSNIGDKWIDLFNNVNK